jgi:predicted amidophosphoribosyltransferase
MGDDILRFEDHRRRQDENASLVRCARCGKLILATATRCSECGVHFQGEAQDYLHSSERPSSGHAVWIVVLVVVLLAATFISALALG